ncbi:MAG TPA: hypothetical protein VH572_03605 [Gaiella sp.]|jgi:hypothetical protein
MSEGRVIGLGPVGVAGLVALVLGFLRRSFLLSLLGGAALAADLTMPELGGHAARSSHAPSDGETG